MSIHDETNETYQHRKAKKALKKAKKLEAEKLKSGKKYIRIDRKTIKLMK